MDPSRVFEIRVLEADLLDPKINLIDHMLGPNEEECARWMEIEKQSPPKIEKLQKAQVSRDLQLLGQTVEALSSKLDMIADKLESVTAAESELDKSVAGVREKMENIDWTGDKDAPASRVRERMDSLLARVEELSGKAAEQDELSELSKRVEELGNTLADRESLEDLGRRLELAGEKAADLDTVRDLVGRLERLEDCAAGRDQVEGLARDIGRVRDGLAGRGEVEDLAEAIKEVRSRLAEREKLEKVAQRLEQMEADYADRESLDKIKDRLEEFSSGYAGRGLLDKVISHLDVAGSRFVDREDHSELMQRLDEIEAGFARRDQVDEVLARLEGVVERMADRDSLGRVEDAVEQKADRESLGRVEDAVEKKADRESLDRVEERLEKLGSDSARKEELAGIAARLEEIGQNYANTESVEKISDMIDEVAAIAVSWDNLREVSEQVEEIRNKAADRGTMERLSESVEKARQQIGRVEKSHQSVMEGLELALRQEGVELEKKLHQLAERLVEFETGMEDLRDLALKTQFSPELENRLLGLELGMSHALSVMPMSAGKEVGEERERFVSGVINQLRKIEGEHDELRNQIKKAFTNLTQYPLRELEDIKKKVGEMEESQEQLAKQAASFSFPGKRLLKILSSTSRRKAASLVVLFLLAGAVGGFFSWRWSFATGGAGRINGGYGDDAPNTVYDNVVPFLSSPTLDIAGDQMSLSDGRADITGYAPGAVNAFMYLNNEEVDHCAVVNQGFSFRGVALEYGVNVIEVKVVDEAGNEANSMASIVEMMSKRAAKIKALPGLNRMRGPHEYPLLALTIDAGASKQRAEQVLAVLRDKGIITTFFLTGQFIERYPEVVKSLVAQGHEVGNHTYSHPHLTTFRINRRHNTAAGASREMLLEELNRTRDLFESLTGEKMAPWWRAPYGEHNREILAWAEEAGFKHVDWTRTPTNFDMLDWIADEHDRYYLDKKGLYRRLVGIASGDAGSANGGIVLMHLGTDRKKDFLDEVLPNAIDELRSRGYRFVTVSRMFSP